MTETNAEIINWIRFAKGDVSGHPFHGNQYTIDGGGFSREQQRTIMVASPRDAREGADHLSGQGLVTSEQAKVMSAVHNQLANGHNYRAQDFFLTHENPEASQFQNPQEAAIGEAHNKADEAHRNASQLWGNVAKFGGADNLPIAVLASHQAEAASNLADEMENKWKGVSKSFSAILKGDVSGHEFHGNQYTEVGSMADHAKELASGNIIGRPDAVARLLAQRHAELSSAHMAKAIKLAHSAGEHLMADNPHLGHITMERANAHERAAIAHDTASKQHSNVASGHPDDMGTAMEATKRAAEASAEADKPVF